MKRIPKTKLFAAQCIKKGIVSPSQMAQDYKEQYGKEVSSTAFTVAMRRMGISPQQRLTLKAEAMKETEVKDISQYDEWTRYFGFADFQQISVPQKKRTAARLRELWEMMNKTNPQTWKFLEGEDSLVQVLKRKIGQNEKGQWNQPHRVMGYLGAYNRTFQGYLPKGWSMGLKRPAGELKDFMEPEVFAEFISLLADTPEMSKEGWISLFECQVSIGCREGSTNETGILSLRWEEINFETLRCKLRDKGEKGHPARLWINLPLDLYPWVNSWSSLMKFHQQQYGYIPDKNRHGNGLVWKVPYEQYRQQFHNTRHKCQTEIRNDDETHVPHIMRKTHAQWCRRMGITLDNLCGDTDSSPSIGRYGVGWTDVNIPKRYYVTKEAWEYAEQDTIIAEHLAKLEAK